jgi:antitoxin MazE
MTALQLRAELFRQMNPLLDSEVALQKVLSFVQSLVVPQSSDTAPREGWAAAAKQAHADGQDKLMAEDIFADETMEDWKW